jgi:hypothetical protein
MAIDYTYEFFLMLTNVGQIMRPDLFEQHGVSTAIRTRPPSMTRRCLDRHQHRWQLHLHTSRPPALLLALPHHASEMGMVELFVMAAAEPPAAICSRR